MSDTESAQLRNDRRANAYERLVNTLHDDLAYFEAHEDVNEDGDGPNRAMSRAQDIRELLRKLGEL